MKSFLKDWVLPLGIAVILALIINRFLFFNIKVPTESMYPTIKPGDRIMVTRIYSPKSLKRGDIVVFKSKELNERLVKRLIGIPGDKVEVKEDGSVLLNGVTQNEPYVKAKGGKSGTFEVPEGSYFFLGDNRPVSFDSRYWNNQFIPFSSLEGKARITIFPFNRMGSLK